jgi:predicted metal-dependent hydrolase
MIDKSPLLTVRKLEVDIASGFDRHWHGGDAFLSQYYNALSMSFPVGEQSFIDAVRECAKRRIRIFANHRGAIHRPRSHAQTHS